MPSRATALIVLAVLLIGSCSRGRSSPFEKERARLQSRVPPQASRTKESALRRDGFHTEAFWEYDFAGHRAAAIQAFRASVPPDYQLLRGGETDLVYWKYDGHDSYFLTLTFARTDPPSTKVTVFLESLPD